jgi:hypothetical protein
MGIKNLTKLISEMAPGIIREGELKEFTGRRIAIDASMAIYQFLVMAGWGWKLFLHLPVTFPFISHAGCDSFGWRW